LEGGRAPRRSLHAANYLPCWSLSDRDHLLLTQVTARHNLLNVLISWLELLPVELWLLWMLLLWVLRGVVLHTGLLGGRGLTRLVEVVGGGLGRGVRGRVAGGGGRSSVLLDVRHLWMLRL